ncbi:MAG: DNA polymerase III subunit gamma/tau [Candidatus Pacebacteria bacterium]|nr:DNA polymerase III subunit gamma/tau [Candidatus Paceibacterota bacterium]
MSAGSHTSSALYRKYRPQSFKDVLGQEHIVSVLEGAIAQGNIAHAYLFSGTRGTGKTSVARILAREIGCSDKDLYEIDAASNRGIDDIRELRDSVHTLPFESPYKVYIIDEVHMLTKEAFNALLKTLEEPPQYVVFVLATTELEKLPETIVSRCQSFAFKKPTQQMLKDMIIRVAKKEGFSVETAAADLLATLAEGSFRDAHGALQKIVSSSIDKKVSVDEVEQVTGAPKGELVNGLLEALQARDLNQALSVVAKVVEQNVDMRVFMKILLQKMRAVLLLRYAKDMEDSFKEQFTKEDLDLLKKLSGEVEVHINSKVIDALLGAYTHTQHTYIPQLPLELALVKLLGKDE